MAALAQEVIQKGGEKLAWNVLKWNGKAKEFYEGLGAKEYRGNRGSEGMYVDGRGLEELASSGL